MIKRSVAVIALANAEYWSGDYRNAAREYDSVLSQQPGNAVAKRSLAEIDAASRAGFRLGMSYLPTGSFDVEIEHATTAFYIANEIRAGLAGRF